MKTLSDDLVTEPKALVIGDVHGHFDRLEALLEQEGILYEGARSLPTKDDVEVIQVGDLGHFGEGTQAQDEACYKAALDGWIDVVLWGNHDRAIKDSEHEFYGFKRPTSGTVAHAIGLMELEWRMKYAHAIHGYLITHAGLHENFHKVEVPEGVDKSNPYDVADWINQAKYVGLDRSGKPLSPIGQGEYAIVNAISRNRGGPSPYGGIMWRDYDEPLYDKFPQIFGHSASKDHQVRQDGQNYCLDVGGKGDRPGDDCLAAIWLPERRIVRVDLDELRNTETERTT